MEELFQFLEKFGKIPLDLIILGGVVALKVDVWKIRVRLGMVEDKTRTDIPKELR